jgi:hypothetical protein
MVLKFYASLMPKRLLSFVSKDERGNQKSATIPVQTAPLPGLEEKRYHIEDKLKKIGPHHESFKQLWETKWKMPASHILWVSEYIH